MRGLLKRDAKEWQSQDNFIRDLGAEKVDNVLVWRDIAHQSRDWDNIPPVVPKYCIQLGKYMEGVCRILKEQVENETVFSLRNFTEYQIMVSQSYQFFFSLKTCNLIEMVIDSPCFPFYLDHR